MRASDLFWLVWFVASFLTFLVKEVWSLIKGDGGTLSEAIWRLEKFHRGQPISHWSAGHVLFLGFWLLVGFLWVWLLGHFILGDWR